MIMEMTLGMSESEANAIGSDVRVDRGIQMKTSFGWLVQQWNEYGGFSRFAGRLEKVVFTRLLELLECGGVHHLLVMTTSVRFLRSDKRGVGRSASRKLLGCPFVVFRIQSDLNPIGFLRLDCVCDERWDVGEQGCDFQDGLPRRILT